MVVKPYWLGLGQRMLRGLLGLQRFARHMRSNQEGCIFLAKQLEKHISIPPPLRGGWGGVKTEIFHFRGGSPPPHLEIFHLPKVKYFSLKKSGL